VKIRRPHAASRKPQTGELRQKAKVKSRLKVKGKSQEDKAPHLGVPIAIGRGVKSEKLKFINYLTK